MVDLPEDARTALDVLRTVGGEEMVGMLLRTFVTFADERMLKIVEESGNGRWEEVASIAHSLKSSARQLGAMPLGDACAETEHAGRGGDVAGARAGVDAITREYGIARAWMVAIANPEAAG